ncbi:MAG: beta-lactamase family protein [Actinobacteria bacterium]|nr:beta-lactamase family protein [Actinomycetota bacterium]
MTSGSPAKLATDDFSALTKRIQQEVDSGNVTAAQYAIGYNGEVAAFQSFGDATDSTRFIIFSATKTLVAMTLLPHLADGTLELTTPVAHYIPEFGHHGKDGVTILQLLTMQGGFPQAPIPPSGWGSSAARRAQFTQWSLEWPAGTRTEYHPTTAHWVIAELIETLSGRGYVEAVDQRIFAPAGVPQLLGPETEQAHTVRSLGERPTDVASLAATFGRADLVPAVTIGPEGLLSLNDRRAQVAAIPGGGAIASAAHVASIYQQFIHNSGGALPDGWLADAVGTIRNGSINVSDNVPANRTIAGYVAGNDGFHLHRWMPAAPRAFGHHGAGGQLCWVDPDSGISFCFLNDTLHQDPRVEFRRAADLNGLVLDLLQ